MEKDTILSQCAPLCGGLVGYALVKGCMTPCHHRELSLATEATVTSWMLHDVCSMILTSTLLGRHLI